MRKWIKRGLTLMTWLTVAQVAYAGFGLWQAKNQIEATVQVVHELANGGDLDAERLAHINPDQLTEEQRAALGVFAAWIPAPSSEADSSEDADQTTPER